MGGEFSGLLESATSSPEATGWEHINFLAGNKNIICVLGARVKGVRLGEGRGRGLEGQ